MHVRSRIELTTFLDSEPPWWTVAGVDSDASWRQRQQDKDMTVTVKRDRLSPAWTDFEERRRVKSEERERRRQQELLAQEARAALERSQQKEMELSMTSAAPAPSANPVSLPAISPAKVKWQKSLRRGAEGGSPSTASPPSKSTRFASLVSQLKEAQSEARPRTPAWHDEGVPPAAAAPAAPASKAAAALRGSVSLPELGRKGGAPRLAAVLHGAGGAAPHSIAGGQAGMSRSLPSRWRVALESASAAHPSAGGASSVSPASHAASGRRSGRRGRGRVGVIKEGTSLPVASAAEVRSQLIRAYSSAPPMRTKGGSSGGGRAARTSAEQMAHGGLDLTRGTIPAHCVTAAEGFARRHGEWLAKAAMHVSSLNYDPTAAHRATGLSDTLTELFRTRLVVTEPIIFKAAKPKKRAPPPPTDFNVYESVWGTRASWNDSGDVYDTEQVALRRFARDWESVVRDLGVGNLVRRSDDDGDADLDGDGISDELQEVQAIIWAYHELIEILFTNYASLTAGNSSSGAMSDASATTIGYHYWLVFLQDFGLILKGKHAKYQTRQDLDRIFYGIDAAAKNAAKARRKAEADARTPGTAPPPPKLNDERSNAFARQEFVAALVHVALNRYVATGRLSDCSEAVHAFLSNDILPNLEPQLASVPNAFREQVYTPLATDVLARYESDLRKIFIAINKGESGREAKLLSLDEWKGLLLGFGFSAKPDLSERDACMCFLSSRTCVVDASTRLGALKESSLPFEGFLEALCRLSVLKALPTDAEVDAAGCDDAGDYVLRLRERDEAAHARLVEERKGRWGELPKQPVHRCVEHLITLMIRIIEAATPGKDNLRLTQQECDEWVKRCCYPAGFAKVR